MESSGFSAVKSQLRTYKNKFYKNQIIRGSLISFGLLSTLFIIINFLEFNFWFTSSVRAGLLSLYLLILFSVVFFLIIRPSLKLFNNKTQISDEDAAKQIGKFFPEINDKLLNIIQLSSNNSSENSLVSASIAQKSSQISVVPFSSAIKFSSNRKYLKYVAGPLLISLIILLFVPQIITESSNRIIKFNEEFEPEKPFIFNILNNDFKVFRNDDLSLLLELEGKSIPESVFIVIDDNKLPISSEDKKSFEYTLKNVQFSKSISFEAAGYTSKEIKLEIIDRPKIRNFQVELVYPTYTKKEREVIQNNSNLSVPEGSTFELSLNAFKTKQVDVLSSLGEIESLQSPKNQLFTLSKTITDDIEYDIELTNEYGKSLESLNLTFDAIADQYPQIKFRTIQDSVLYQNILLGGNISDDYGITDFSVFYSINGSEYKKKKLSFDKGELDQNFYYNWDVSEIALQQNDQIKYYLQITDNDGFNGRKSTKTAVYSFEVPDKKELEEELEKSSQQAENQLDKTIQEAKELNEKLDEAEEQLRGEKQLDWEDKKLVQELIEKKEKITEELEKVQKENQLDQVKRERFNKQNESIKKKAEQLQQIMEELLDEETKKLYDELQKLLEEQNKESLQETLQELQKNESNLENELERALELFKRLKFENKLEETINDLDELSKEQQDLSKETQEKGSNLDSLTSEQQDIEDGFEDIKEKIEELNELNKDLKQPEPVQDTKQQEQQIEENLSDSKEQLNKGKRKKASQSQQKSSQSLQQLSDKLQQMQANLETLQLQENIQNLRDIVDNLVKLSFEQERILTEFKEVNQSDPRFVELSQNQLKLKDDAQIVEDSLMALASRVFQIQSYITREVTEMNDKVELSLKALRERKRRDALVNQQLAMTSINNLAILLDDVLQQMQSQMAQAMGKQSGKPQKGQQPTPSLSQLQQQLNERIEDLKKGGKSGRKLSEELAKLAAEQEKLRKLLQEEGKKAGSKQLNGEKEEEGGSGAGGNLESIIDKMEETELDLVNKQITQETINRQKEIQARMLEAEESLREREQEQKREAQTASEYEKQLPKAFEEYIKAREKELEILKTVPIELSPYFKKEVNKYFRRLENNN